MKEDKVIAPDYWEKRYWKYRKYAQEELVNAEILNLEYREKLVEAEGMVDDLYKENEELKNKIKEYEKKFGYKNISES